MYQYQFSSPVAYPHQPRYQPVPYPQYYAQPQIPIQYQPSQRFLSQQPFQYAPPNVFTSRLPLHSQLQPRFMSPKRTLTSPTRSSQNKVLQSPVRAAPPQKQTKKTAPDHDHFPLHEPFVHHKKKEQPKELKKTPEKTPEKAQTPVPQEESEELALQYEDGFIYRGMGIPPQTRQGWGVLFDQDNNEVYSGNWQDNQYQGEGELNNLQADQIDGPLDYNDMSSVGNYWLKYKGQFKLGKMHGKGELKIINQERYVGSFEDGMIDGQGEYHTQSGKVIKGVWKQGVLQK